MNLYKFLYLIWFLPAYLLLLCIHQTAVYYSVGHTYKNGTSYAATVVDYGMEQIGAQHNGHIKIQFTTRNGQKHTRQMSLPVEMAPEVNETNIVPIRYKKGDFIDIVMMPAYKTQKDLALTNIGMGAVGFLLTVFACLLMNRYIKRKTSDDDQPMIVERLDE